MATCSTTGCANPLGLPCHSCRAPLCWSCSRSFFLVAHCSVCWARDHSRQATAQQQPVPARPRSTAPAVGDVCLLPGGQHLLVVNVWYADPPATLGRVTCLLGASWTPPGIFVPVKPHQSALFGFSGPGQLPFERVGSIEPDVARRIHRDGQTLLAVASGS